MAALAPTIEQAKGIVLEHLTDPQRVTARLAEAIPELLVLVDPLPGCETVAFWNEFNAHLGSAMSWTVVAASSEALFDLESLEDAGVQLVNLENPPGGLEPALSSFLRKTPRPHTRVMVKIAVELGAGKVLRIAQTVIVSRSGLLIRTQEQFPSGSTLDLKMELPGDTDPIEARAEVVRMTDVGVEDVRGLGARFTWFRGQDEKRFDDFMLRAIGDTASSRPD
jgi:hypothetical protein